MVFVDGVHELSIYLSCGANVRSPLLLAATIIPSSNASLGQVKGLVTFGRADGAHRQAILEAEILGTDPSVRARKPRIRLLSGEEPNGQGREGGEGGQTQEEELETFHLRSAERSRCPARFPAQGSRCAMTPPFASAPPPHRQIITSCSWSAKYDHWRRMVFAPGFTLLSRSFTPLAYQPL